MKTPIKTEWKEMTKTGYYNPNQVTIIYIISFLWKVIELWWVFKCIMYWKKNTNWNIEYMCPELFSWIFYQCRQVTESWGPLLYFFKASVDLCIDFKSSNIRILIFYFNIFKYKFRCFIVFSNFNPFYFIHGL